MTHTDGVADLLTRIRNANRIAASSTVSPYSTLRERVAKVLCDEGYLSGVEVVQSGKRKELVVSLRYGTGNQRVITGIERVSKPGRRVYIGYKDVKPVRNGLGITILSTPRGIVSDTVARKMRAGGEMICRVW